MTEQLRIEKLVYGGEGLSRVDGEVVFTPFVLPGETVEAERTGSRKKAQRARLVNVAEPSPARVSPLCPYFGHCGGCQYQHAGYEAQLELKRGILAETLRRVGKIEFDEARIETVAGEPFGYRNRVQFHFERGRMGYRELNSHKLVPIEKCPISSPKINEAIVRLNTMVRDRRWPNFVSSLEIFTDERHVQWNVLESDKPVAKHFFEWLADEVPGTVLGALEYAVNEDEFTVSGQAFFQVNRFLAPRLAELAIGDAKGEAAWDLYAGVGLFSLPLSRRFARVTAVEAGRAASAEDRRAAATDGGVSGGSEDRTGFRAGGSAPVWSGQSGGCAIAGTAAEDDRDGGVRSGDAGAGSGGVWGGVSDRTRADGGFVPADVSYRNHCASVPVGLGGRNSARGAS